MAITRAQQAKQMLQNGGMLVQPGFGGTRQGYRGDDAAKASGRSKGQATSRDTTRAESDRSGTGDTFDRESFQEAKRKGEIRELIKQQEEEKGRGIDPETGLSRANLESIQSLGLSRSNFPGVGGMVLNATLPFRRFTLEKNKDYFIGLKSRGAAENYAATADGYRQYMADRLAGKIDAAGNLAPGFMRVGDQIVSTGNDGREDPIIPIIPKPIEQEEVEQIARNFGGLPARITGSLFDFTGMADGGRIGAMGGGMMDLDSARQMMFLGGIAKSISKGLKGVTRAAKKVFKSPVGKAALLGLGAYYAPGIGIKATGGFPEFTKPGGFLSTLLTKGGDKALNLDNLSGLKIAGLLTAAPFLFSSDEEEEDKPTDMGPTLTMEELLAIRANPFKYLTPNIAGSQFAAEGGRIGYQKGSKEPVAKKVMPLLDMGGKEMDLRDNGGFVPIGRMEKADDVPARLSKNEFVFTADAVRNAGDGDVDKGAEVMYNMMKNLERGGNVSEESQGLEGAREMFQTAQRLGEVV